MQTSGIAKYIKVSARKIRPIARTLSKMPVDTAIDHLKFVEKKNAIYIKKLLESVRANAQIINPDVKTENVYIKEIKIDEGPTMKRFRVEARGRIHRIRKRTSHISVTITDEKGDSNGSKS